jgi:DNA-binding protein H-NS
VPKSLAQVNAQIAKLQKEADALKAKQLDGVVSRIKEAIQHYGLTARDLGLSGRIARRPMAAAKPAAQKVRARTTRKGPRKGTGVVKYRGAEGQSWTGHGRAPNWYKEAIAGGATQESLLVK